MKQRELSSLAGATPAAAIASIVMQPVHYHLFVMTTATNFFVTAATLRSCFSEYTRDDGSKYWSYADMMRTEEVADLVCDCHDEELPNDWRYGMIVSILDAITEYDRNTNWSNAANEIADRLVEFNTCRLFQWYADDSSRVDYVNSGIDEGLISEDQVITSQLLAGQYLCIHQMVHQIMAALDLDC